MWSTRLDVALKPEGSCENDTEKGFNCAPQRKYQPGEQTLVMLTETCSASGFNPPNRTGLVLVTFPPSTLDLKTLQKLQSVWNYR